MDWASRRRLVIASIVVGTLLLITSILVFWQTYQPPSCSDGKLNQDETGIDCGGSCPYLCVQENIPPTVLYVLPLTSSTTGRTDVIAMVENKNSAAAARGVPYTLKLYSAQGAVIKEVQGTIDLVPRSVVPIYIPRALDAGNPARAFLEIPANKIAWYSLTEDPRIVPVVENRLVMLKADKPRLDMTVINESLYPLSRVPLIAIVLDVETNNIVGVTATIVDVAPQGRSTASFLWNEPFRSTLIGHEMRHEVYPIVPLP